MGEEKSVVSACGSCVAGVVLVEGVGLERCDECKKFESDEDAASAVWSLWEQTNTFLALGDDESAESFGKALDEAGSKL